MDRNKAISFMHDLLRMMVSKDGSDLFITTGSPPAMKIDGRVATVSKQNLSPHHTQMLARSITRKYGPAYRKGLAEAAAIVDMLVDKGIANTRNCNALEEPL